MSFLAWFIRFCVSLRYKVVLEGEEIIKKYKDTSILFVANHPATIDPVIVLSALEPYVMIQPLAAQKFFKSSLILFFLKKLNAHAVPEFEDGSNDYKAYKVQKLFEDIKQALKQKAKILIYPAGHLSDGTYEKIGGASLAFDLKNESKKMLGVAISGLYGSMFSRYYQKSTPHFLNTLLKAIKMALCNGIFFLPRRKVTIQIFEIDEKTRCISDKFAFNQALDRELNSRIIKAQETLSYGVCKAPQSLKKHQKVNVDLDPDMEKELLKMAEHVVGKPVGLDEHLSYHVGIDSLQVAEIMAFVEQKYHVRLQVTPETLRELGGYILSSAQAPIVAMKPLSPRRCLKLQLDEEGSLLDAFYSQKNRAPSRRMASDLVLGEVSYKKAGLIIDILSSQIKQLEGEFIGVLLPSSVMAYLLTFSILAAGKKPVMLNWTSGRKSIDYGVDLLKIHTILSSERFLEKAFGVDLGSNFDKILSLESLKQSIPFGKKFSALLRSFLRIDPEFPYLSKDDVACVLFTSGSESAPKAVPLTHKNILANMKGLLDTGLIKDTDRFLATLPPFHSFGCVVSGFFPLVLGLDTMYLPDPTDAIAIASAVDTFKASLFCSAPSFLKQILTYQEKGQLDSMRLVVVGAEKLHDSLRELFSSVCPRATLLEGYGITECSPVVTIQENVFTKGVGKPLKGIELLIVDPDSGCVLPSGEVGEILVSAESVFSGYIGLKKDPFVIIDGKKWYKTGDRGHISVHRELILQGRFKRFIKIAAEMISLSAIEQAIESFRPPLEGMVQFAVIADASLQKLVLVTIHPNLDLDEVNQHLRSCGLPKVAKISEIRHVRAIPQLATGKIDYRALENAHI